MRLKRWLRGVILATACIMPSFGWAQPFGHFGHGGPMPMPMMMIVKQAHLSADQEAKARKIMEDSAAQTRPLLKQLHAIHEQIADKLLSKGSLTATDLAPLRQQENQVQQQLDQQMLNSALQVRSLLTPEQLTRVAELHTKLKALHEQMRALIGEGDNPPPPPGADGPPPPL